MNEDIDHVRLLHKKIFETLLKEWDPIGIQDISEAQDEYDAYVSPVYQLLISGKSESKIFEYLWWIETKHMGLSGNRHQTTAIARKLRTLNSSHYPPIGSELRSQ